MSIKAKKLLSGILYFLLVPAFSAFSQTSTVSPYSRFGPGDLLFDGYANQVGMGGISNSGNSATKLNFNNPASYAYDTLMILDFSLSSELLHLKQSSTSGQQINSTLNNLSIGFPLKRGVWGMAFGFIPYTGTGYNIQTNTVLDSANSASFKYLGTGGFTRYYIGTGVKITKNFSAGINASYLFGTIDRTRKILFSSSNYFDTRYNDELNVGDLYLEMGLNYNGRINSKYNYSFGITGAPAQKINAKRTTLWENYTYDVYSDLDKIRDTVSYSPDEKGTIILPARIGVGFQLIHTKYSIGLDFNYQDWSSYKVYGASDSLKNSYKIAVGAQWIPNQKGLNYYEKIQYRGGFYYNQTFLELNNTSLSDYGISLGLGMPFRKAYGSMFNVGVIAGKRGTIDNSLIREQYLKLVFGITLNEDWFRRSKYH